MPATVTPAYITTIRPDRTIVVPDEMAIGATVAVVILPAMSEPNNPERKERFEATLRAINNASTVENAPRISDEQLNKLIKEAVKRSAA
jgi:hypothetical protein